MATATAVADVADDTTVGFRCRIYNHSWDEFFPIDLSPPTYGWRLSLRCVRCGSERFDNLDFKGRLMSRRYRYVEGYQQKGAPPRSMFREALFEKLRGKLEEINSVGAEVPPPSRRKKKVAV
jgi:hypothetical protein